METVGDLIRLAWQSDREGRTGMRDALLTLAVAESGPEDAVTAERCRKWLIARRPDHWFAAFPTRGQALNHPRIAGALRNLRASYPPVRVRWMLMRGESQRGPYRGSRQSLRVLFDDLVGPPEGARPLLRPQPASGEIPALPFPTVTADDPASVEALRTFYLTVLLAIALLLVNVVEPAAHDTKAA